MKTKKTVHFMLYIALALFVISCGKSDKKNGESAAANAKTYKWKMTTTWPPNFPVLGEVANKYAEWVEEMSNGRIKIKVYGAGELVPALEAFDAVSNGSIQVAASTPYYWVGKVPAAQFFAAVPFGMNAQQGTAWILRGGGMELWRKVYEPFNVVPFLGGASGVQMGGWFNKEINSTKDLKGLKMRLPGLGGKVLEKAGGTAVLVAGGEIYTSLERGVIDATEWIGPYHDYKMGFYKIAKHYYKPGWHEPNIMLEFLVNKKILESLPKDLQAILETASIKAHTWVLSEFESKNGEYLEKLVKEEKVDIREFSDETLSTLRKYTDEVIQELIAKDPLSKEVFESYHNFHMNIAKWSSTSEKAYYDKIQAQ